MYRSSGDNAVGYNTTCDPIICEKNHYVLDNKCYGCKPGSIRDNNDNATGFNTNCED
jgi:hypothetical protein